MNVHAGPFILTLMVLVTTMMHRDTLKKQHNYSTVRGDGEGRVGEVRASTTSPMPKHKGFKPQYCLDSNNSYGENDSNKFIHLNFEKKNIIFLPLTNSYTQTFIYFFASNNSYTFYVSPVFLVLVNSDPSFIYFCNKLLQLSTLSNCRIPQSPTY